MNSENRPESKSSFRYRRIVVENKNFGEESRDWTDVRNCYAEKRTSNGDKKNSSGDSGRQKAKQEPGFGEDSEGDGGKGNHECRRHENVECRENMFTRAELGDASKQIASIQDCK